MYAIVRTGGKQYRVEEGRTVNVELLPAEEGSSVELNDVLLIADDGDVTVGTPTIDGARVLAEVESHGRNKKIVVYKYKAKVRTRKKTGHRQHHTRLAVTEILRPGQESKAAKPKRRRAKKDETPEEEAVAETPATAEAEEKPAPRRRARKPAAATAEAKTPTDAEAEEKPKRRTRKAAPRAEAKTPTETDEKPKRRTRKAATPKASAAGDDKEKKPARRRSSRAKAADKKDGEE